MKIFQIGFNRCGTLSLFRFFTSNEVPSVHWMGGNLARRMHKNKRRNQPLLEEISEYVFYSDMEYVGAKEIIEAYKYYKTLDEQYPDSKFILNTRDKNEWIESRVNHRNGSYLKRYMQCYNKSKDEMIRLWKQDWEKHTSEVLQYFTNRNNLLVYHIKNDDPQKIIDFLPNINFIASDMPHVNKS